MPELIPPPVPADIDLTDFKFMPLVVERLRRSRAWLICKRRPELAFYMINLWTASWHERPAASLENDDDVLADMAMCSPEKWVKIRSDVLRGWSTHADGRLYHPVVAELANEAWLSKTVRMWRTECARVRKANQRNKTEEKGPDYYQWLIDHHPFYVTWDIGVVSRVTGIDCHMGQRGDVTSPSQGCPALVPEKNGPKRQGQGQGQGQGDIYSEAIASAPAQPTQADVPIDDVPKTPVDVKALLWSTGVPYLVKAAGLSDSKSRTMIGKWRREHGDVETLNALAASQTEAALNPIEFIEAVLRKKRNGGKQPIIPDGNPFAQHGQDGYGRPRSDLASPALDLGMADWNRRSGSD